MQDKIQKLLNWPCITIRGLRCAPRGAVLVCFTHVATYKTLAQNRSYMCDLESQSQMGGKRGSQMCEHVELL